MILSKNYRYTGFHLIHRYKFGPYIKNSMNFRILNSPNTHHHVNSCLYLQIGFFNGTKQRNASDKNIAIK